MNRSSLALRLALLVGILGLLQAVAVLAFSHVTLKKELDAQRRAVLRDKTQHARHLIDDLQDATAIKANAYKLNDLVTGHAELHLAVASAATGQAYIAFSPEAMQSLTRLKVDTWQTDAFLTWKSRDQAFTMLSFSTAGKTRNGQPYEIVITIDRSEDERLLNEQLVTAATAAPLALAFVFLSALFIVSVGLRPLQRFKQAVGKVSAKTLTVRLETAQLPAELSGLGAAFNSMLERLDDSLTRLSQFSGDLAHEMRTPLSTLLGRTQVALSQPRSAEQLADVLEANVEEIQRLSRLVSDMLFLAQSDQAENARVLETVSLHQEAGRIAEYLETVAEERQVSIAVSGEAFIVADPGLVQRATANLLTNAVRHCSPGTSVQVIVKPVSGGATLEVVNLGEAIPAEHLDRIFDRFYRIDSARGRDLGGTGLGLAIVKAIMALHGGTVQASNTATGKIRFTLYFPVKSVATAI